jgi:hypothetical protein
MFVRPNFSVTRHYSSVNNKTFSQMIQQLQYIIFSVDSQKSYAYYLTFVCKCSGTKTNSARNAVFDMLYMNLLIKNNIF